MTVAGAIGLVGVLLYLGSYAMLQLGRLRASGHAYTFLNIAAAGCVLISLDEEFNLSSLLIQVSWIAISVAGLTRRYLVRRRMRFDGREKVLSAEFVPGLTSFELRRFLDIGDWVHLPADTALTLQGAPVGHLYFILRGEARVLVDETEVAQVREAGFIGEMTCLTGAPATATVLLTAETEAFRIPAPRLRAFLRANPDIAEQLERAFGADLRRKLRASAALVARLSRQRGIAAE